MNSHIPFASLSFTVCFLTSFFKYYYTTEMFARQFRDLFLLRCVFMPDSPLSDLHEPDETLRKFR